MTLRKLTYSQPGSLSRSGLRAELRALGQVIRKEWVIFRRYPSWIIALFVWPVIFPAAYILTARALAGPGNAQLALFTELAGTQDVIGYIAIGTTIYMWQNVVLWNVGFALREEQLRGTLESNWLSPSWRFNFLLGNGITQALIMFIFLGVSALEFGLFFNVHLNGSLFLTIFVLLAAVPSIFGIGFAFASLVITAKEANGFVFLVRGIVMIFCGITFPLAVLPEWMARVAAWLPQTYAIQAMRAVVLGGATLPEIWPDLSALLLFGLAWLAAGYVLFNWMERRSRRTGSIGHY